ncbi:MAG: RNA-binding protein [bacterium]|nr:RNA-binding protein [bacterium]
MPKGPRDEKRPADVVGCAVHVARIATGEIEETTNKQPAKRKAGVAGGRARAAALTSEQRSEIARQAATARWG